MSSFLLSEFGPFMMYSNSQPLYYFCVHKEFGVITTNQVSLSSSSFLADPLTFTLMGETRGGPPTTFDWRRNGVEITNSSSFTISISLKNVEERFTESVYVSILVVRGNLPGVYQYSVTNRAMTNSRNDNFTIEG